MPAALERTRSSSPDPADGCEHLEYRWRGITFEYVAEGDQIRVTIERPCQECQSIVERPVLLPWPIWGRIHEALVQDAQEHARESLTPPFGIPSVRAATATADE